MTSSPSVAILEPLLADSRGRTHHVESAKLANALVAAYLEAGDLHRSVEVGERTLDELEARGPHGDRRAPPAGVHSAVGVRRAG